MKDDMQKLQIFAAQIRKAALVALHTFGSGHVGGSMSMAELMAVLYGAVMRHDPANPGWEDRDWLVVSKGHCGPAVYAALALRGFFPYEELKTLNQPGTRLPSHCDRNRTPGIDMTTGSLGQGLSAAVGIAWGHAYQKRANTTYCVLGDGECNEGQVWEAALFAATKKVGNLIAFIDANGKQLDGYTRDICDLGDLRQKFADFGWNAYECDGHDVGAIVRTITQAKGRPGKPAMIVLHTTKGRDCTFAENEFYNHHIVIKEEGYQEAVACLDAKIAQLESGVEQ